MPLFRQRLFENLRMLPHAPGVQMQAIPEDATHEDSGDEEEDTNKRVSSKNISHRYKMGALAAEVVNQQGFILTVFCWLSVRAQDKRIACDEEFSDSEDEGEGGRRNTASYKKAKRAKTDGEKEAEEKKKGEEETKGISFIFLIFISSSLSFWQIYQIFFIWSLSVAFFVFLRYKRREGARGGENGHIKVRKSCRHILTMMRLTGCVNISFNLGPLGQKRSPRHLEVLSTQWCQCTRSPLLLKRFFFF